MAPPPTAGSPTSPVPAADPPTAPGLTAPTQRGFSSRLIGDIVVDMGFATREAVDAAVDVARGAGQPTGRVLLRSGALSTEQLARVVAERFGLDHADLLVFPVDFGVARLVPLELLQRRQAVPIGWGDPQTLLVAVAEPSNVGAVDDIALQTGHAVRPVIADKEDIALLLGRLQDDSDSLFLHDPVEAVTSAAKRAADETAELRASADEGPVVRLVHSVLAQAIERGASDVHLAPHSSGLSGQFRIDGVLVPSVTIPRRLVLGVISRIKIMAELDIAERRMPQDGRMTVSVGGREVDLRVVTLPLVGGESVVLRILDRPDEVADLDRLGMPAPERRRFVRACDHAHGAVLVTGPTGSGKTTTLYAALNRLNTGDRSILTIEDPVEYRIDGVKQMQVNTKAGVTFADGLRSMLRADPDVVMVGEIRDRAAGQIAIEAALTGHLVLSTLHTNDAPSAFTRLLEMGVESFLVASAVRCVVAQRLLRRLCPHCRRPIHLDVEALRIGGFTNADSSIDGFAAGGCRKCAGSGYRGRLGIYECLDMTDELHDLVLHRGTSHEIGIAAEATGMRRLRDVALERVRAGDTSVAEAARVLGE